MYVCKGNIRTYTVPSLLQCAAYTQAHTHAHTFTHKRLNLTVHILMRGREFKQKLVHFQLLISKIQQI